MVSCSWISALYIQTEADPDTMEPKDTLDANALSWCQGVGSKATTVSGILASQDALVLKGVQEGIDRANKKATSRAQCIQKWTILPRDFSVPTGELGKIFRPGPKSIY